MKRVKNRGGNGKIMRKQRNYVIPLSPPELTTSIQFTHTYRWTCIGTSGVTNQLITTGMLMDTLVFSVTTLATFSIIDAFRMKRVDLWAPAITNGFNQTTTSLVPAPPSVISLEFNGAGAGNVGTKPNRVLDTSMGAARNACLSLRPPRDSAASMWQVTPESGSQTVGTGIIITCPYGSIIDITMSFKLQNNSSPNAGPTAAAAVLVQGTLYQAPLGGTSGNWAALGAPTYPV